MNTTTWRDRLNQKDYWILTHTAEQTDSGCPSFTRANRELINSIQSEIEQAEKRGECKFN